MRDNICDSGGTHLTASGAAEVLACSSSLSSAPLPAGKCADSMPSLLAADMLPCGGCRRGAGSARLLDGETGPRRRDQGVFTLTPPEQWAWGRGRGLAVEMQRRGQRGERWRWNAVGYTLPTATYRPDQAAEGPLDQISRPCSPCCCTCARCQAPRAPSSQPAAVSRLQAARNIGGTACKRVPGQPRSGGLLLPGPHPLPASLDTPSAISMPAGDALAAVAAGRGHRRRRCQRSHHPARARRRGAAACGDAGSGHTNRAAAT